MKILKYLPPKQRRLGVLISLVFIFGGWSLILPPTEKLEPIEMDLATNNLVGLDEQGWHSLAISTKPNYLAWDLPVNQPEKKQMVPIIKKEVKPVPIVNRKVLEVIRQPEAVPYEPSKSGGETSRIKYLGQVLDSSGVQVFLIIDDSSVVMRPHHIYGQTWKIININDDEVRLIHLPTQQILRVAKS
ncbi:hypothetical protein [Acinetobacter gyllenbergii]|uniref:hypothetical protein n=1 Tax=Acinetobacter gyllenbergii TaxID=134534 RepID=UPI000806CA88|nr:hypothetical protein [Acinetobacter gyllenbergii]OBY74845.1 hypothetical protein NG55_07850 [Acinetobacter gyllenbergii]